MTTLLYNRWCTSVNRGRNILKISQSANWQTRDIFSKQFLSFPDTGAIPIAYKRSPNPGIVFIAV